MHHAFICDALRTPIGRYGGALSSVRTDDLAAVPLKALLARHPKLDWAAVTDVIYGCANQAGEDNRNVAHMASLLAGLPIELPGSTINRLCGSGMDAVGTAARAIKSGEAQLMIAGGVESMSRAPFVMPKAESAFSRSNAIYDTTIGWRFVNKLMKEMHGVDSMPETAENVATDYKIEREAQDRMAMASQLKAVAAQQAGFFDAEITPVVIPQKKGEAIVVNKDEHPRETSLEALAKLKGVVRPDGTVTAGNASGVNDGSCALLLSGEAAAAKHGLTPRARVVGMATAGVPPRIMGIGPAPATRKVLALTGLTLAQMDVIELNEAFAAQGLAVLRDLGLPDDDPRINPNGGAIALGHPLGASGARLVTTAVNQLHRIRGRYALCTMCIGVGQGIALIVERGVITTADIEAAAARVSPHVRRTPLWVLRSGELGLPGADFEVWLKLEQLQVSGSFKARGMFNRLLANPLPAAGVIAASGGNAGIATATAAQALGVPAEIFVPTVISPAKRDRLHKLGATVVVTGAAYADAFSACQQRQQETGALMTHAYDQPEVLAGAGTLAREIEQQAGVPDALLVSVGGGGLVGGIAAWFAGRTHIVALEPELAPTLHAALAAGAPVDVEVGGIAADALGARRLGALAWDVAQRHPLQSVVLRDEAILDAQRWLWQSLKLAVEPAAALPLAALRSGAVEAKAGQRICLVLCGANVDPATLV